jgi:hypothetical protein
MNEKRADHAAAEGARESVERFLAGIKGRGAVYPGSRIVSTDEDHRNGLLTLELDPMPGRSAGSRAITVGLPVSEREAQFIGAWVREFRRAAGEASGGFAVSPALGGPALEASVAKYTSGLAAGYTTGPAAGYTTGPAAGYTSGPAAGPASVQESLRRWADEIGRGAAPGAWAASAEDPAARPVGPGGTFEVPAGEGPAEPWPLGGHYNA